VYASVGSTPSGARYEAFVKQYEAAGGSVSDIAYAPHTYDAVGILARVIQSVAIVNSAGHLEIGRQSLANAVRATPGYAGLTGDITFDANGDRLSGAVTIYQVQQGQWAPVNSDGP
jgi:branched-chain amino acid transport system substrate-binding protein